MAEHVYKKVGRKYVPIGWHDPQADYLPAGAHLFIVAPGSRACYFNVNPANADVLAALRLHRQAAVDAAMKASELQPLASGGRKLTAKERKAWAAYCEVMGPDASIMLKRGSASDIVDAVEAAIVAACTKA